MRPVPPRLFVVPAPGSPHAVVLRRGPTGQFAALGWNRDTDVVAMGQWLKARIYEYRCDLSPDGRHFIYFAGTARPGGALGGFWTAVSRAPYLHAIYLRGQGQCGSWHGGGAFTGNGRFWLNGGPGPEPEGDELQQDHVSDWLPHSTDGFFMGDLYAARMQRQGWRKTGTGYDVVLTRPLDHGWTLRWQVAIGRRNRPLVSDALALVHDDGRALDQPDWTWADVWRGGLRVAARGRLWSAAFDADKGAAQFKEIYDFNAMTYQALRAPYDTGAGQRVRP